MYNNLEEKKDETCSEEQVTTIHSNNIHEEEAKAPRVRDTVTKETYSEEYKNHDMIKPQRVVDPPREMKTILGTKYHPR